jgi:hypothetical protein
VDSDLKKSRDDSRHAVTLRRIAREVQSSKPKIAQTLDEIAARFEAEVVSLTTKPSGR